MDRVNGNNPVDIGGGRRGFQSQNAAAGVAGTEVTAKYLNDVQEEICAVIENAGLVLDSSNQQQLWEAMQSIAAPGFANRAAWLPVVSMTTTAPPNGATLGDAYIIPAGATGAWAGNQQKLAEWAGSTWRIVDTKNGHGVSLPDGRVFEKIDGVYVEKLALDAQSGKWAFATTAGTASALTASISPAPDILTDGMLVRIVPSIKPNGAATLNLNGLGAKPILGGDGVSIRSGDMAQNTLALIAYSSVLNGWILLTPPRLLSQLVGFKATTVTTGTSIPASVKTNVRFNDVVFDTSASYNSGNGQFTVPKDGVYSVSANFYFPMIDQASYVFILKNGNPVAESSANTRGRVLSVSTLESCKAEDILRIQVQQDSTGNIATPPGTYPFTFSATLLGSV
ncbi:DUF2793 domain-containing protein [Brucella rhizosphaerae]|uniref:DUF2793 domain-containing protein n=1 Tax=Brucella rhizosphaerae TaxID=571254 RepID=UPI000467C509|nr:DUF2793 domain-containing protein [Brucella rhizosphaerae]